MPDPSSPNREPRVSGPHPAGRDETWRDERGLTLFELLVAMTISAILSGIAIASHENALHRARVGKHGGNGGGPGGTGACPGGHGHPQGARKDRSLVPINCDYDLYSMGPEGETAEPLTAKKSRVDIIRAGDGACVGPASEF